MFEVIISTISSGRVQRKLFDTLDEAESCVAEWDSRTSPWTGNKSYRVEMQHRNMPAIQAVAGRVSPVQAATTHAA